MSQKVWGSIPGFRSFVGKSSEILMCFIQPEGVELCPRSWDISGTKFRDPDPFQCPRRCGVPSWGPDHLWERAPRPQCVSFNLRVWNSVPGLGTFLGQSSETPIHFNVPECVGFHPGVQIICGKESRDPNVFHST